MGTCSESSETLLGFSLSTDWELRGQGVILLFSGFTPLLSSTDLQPSHPRAKTKMPEWTFEYRPAGIFCPTIREGAMENTEKDTNEEMLFFF